MVSGFKQSEAFPFSSLKPAESCPDFLRPMHLQSRFFVQVNCVARVADHYTRVWLAEQVRCDPATPSDTPL